MGEPTVLVGVIAAVMAALGTIVAAVVRSRAAQPSPEDRHATEIDTMAKLADQLRADVSWLEEDRDGLRGDIDRLRADLDRCQQSLNALRKQVEGEA